MAQVLKADGTADVAYAEFDNGSAIDTFWIEIETAFLQAALDFWDSDGDGIDVIKPITAALGTARSCGVLGRLGTGCIWNPSDIDVLVTGDEYHTVKYHRNGANIDILVDGDLIRSQTTGAAAAQYFRFGIAGGPASDPSPYMRSVKIGTTEGGTDIFEWNGLDLSQFAVTGDVSVVDDPWPPSPPIAPPTQVFGGTRFYEAPPWRMIVGDLEDNTLTFLDRLALDRSVTVTRAAARVIGGRVPSDNPEVNIPAPDPDGEPFLSEGTRIVSCFRREAPRGSNEAPWVIRARGLVLSLEDDADSDHATSTFTAYDPWKYLYRRPMLDAGAEPGDVSYPAGTRANEIIIGQLTDAIGIGGTIYTDVGQTAFYAGTIEDTEPLPDDGDGLAMTFRSGTTLGEMLDLLVATGTCDVVFDPIFDIKDELGNPTRPGLLCELSIYRVAGEFRPNAVMGWDRWPRSLVGLSRQVEGTERADIVQMYAGQGGPPVPREFDAASVARFGQYWALQYLPGVPSLAGAHTIAQRQLALLKDGQYTYALSPASERAPLLFEEYREADTVPVYASDRFRDPISGVPVRVESIPIVIGDDSLERVNQMLVSFAPESIPAFVMKSYAADGDAYAAKDLGSPQGTIWITLRMRFGAAAFALWVGFNDSGYFVRSVGPSDHLSLGDRGGGFGWSNSYGSGGTPTADTWHLVETRYTNGGPAQVYVDTVLTVDETDGGSGDAQVIWVGQDISDSSIDPDPSEIVYIDFVKMGTTRGASDLFADDFEDGTLDAWTTTVGDVSVVSDPF